MPRNRTEPTAAITELSPSVTVSTYDIDGQVVTVVADDHARHLVVYRGRHYTESSFEDHCPGLSFALMEAMREM